MYSPGVCESLKGRTWKLRSRCGPGPPEASPSGQSSRCWCNHPAPRPPPSPARVAVPAIYLGPACRAPARAVAMAPRRPAPSALRRPARGPTRPSLCPALLRGRGWGGGGRRRRREEIGGATPAAHWLPHARARSPASLERSRDPFQRWPPCCFDE